MLYLHKSAQMFNNITKSCAAATDHFEYFILQGDAKCFFSPLNLLVPLVSGSKFKLKDPRYT